MLNNLLNDAVQKNSFTLLSKQDSTATYQRVAGDAKRFIIIYEADIINDINDIHDFILETTPKELTEDSAFNKNTDLIIILKLDNLSDFKKLESKIFAIEEDPYHFKKYVLYYIRGEELLLENKTYADLENIISDQSLFDIYKDSPLTPSIYSLAARIFIKLPFLDLPKKQTELTPLGLQAQELIAELGFTELDNKVVETIASDANIDDLIKELLKDEMENI